MYCELWQGDWNEMRNDSLLARGIIEIELRIFIMIDDFWLPILIKKYQGP